MYIYNMNKLITLGSFFKKTAGQRSNGLFKKDSVNLRDAIYNSYDPQDTLGGYVKDKDLSGQRQQVYVDEANKKLLYSVAGTRSGTDVFNDIRLATGGLKNTERYKSADRTLKSARDKYDGYDTSIIGSSLGGAIASRLGGADDTRITYNEANVFGRSRDNTTKIRDRSDIVSSLGMGQSSSFGTGLGLLNPFSWASSHSSDRLKGQSYFV
jgi:hypothetical protein